ncbi:MAG TPA: hypothetical protein VFZ59_26635 [Verrucomicrobiae bacterium]|nr:hypothetical protein [Verrucomicrobiae bacterium]
MDVWPQELRYREGSVEASVRIETAGRNAETLWYRLPAVQASSIPESLDPFVIGILFCAMCRGTDLQVHGVVSPSLLRNLEEFQAAWYGWNSHRYHRVEIQADTEREDAPAPTDEVAMTFSGGLDSCFTAWRHVKGEPGRRKRKLQAAIMVHGFDIPLNETETFDRAAENSRLLTADIGLELIPITCNIREFEHEWQQSHGAGLASCLHLLRHRFPVGLIAGSHAYSGLRFPWGSNPVTDPMLSSASLSLVYDGADFTRREKAREVAKWSEAMTRMRVCWEGEHKDRNCGRCLRCIGTAICFAVERKPVPASLPIQSLESAIGALESVPIKPVSLTRLEELLVAARDSRIKAPWVAALDRCIQVQHGKTPVTPPSFTKRLRTGLRHIFSSTPGQSAPAPNSGNGAPSGNGQGTHDLYRQLDGDINARLGIDLGFTALIRPTSYPMDEATVTAFRERYATIKRFQDITLAIFNASLRGEADPEIAQAVLGDVPASWGADYHRQLTERQHRTPTFFRTDEPVTGKLSEIQCPGSGWCLAEELLTLYRDNRSTFGLPRHFGESLAASFAETLRRQMGKAPIVHHLAENASRPHGARYFMQRTREHGIKYFSYDRDIAPQDCNFVRSHDFITLPHHNFFVERLERCEQGALSFDLSPSALFDGKIILAWPFWQKTRQFYDDRIRAIFPFTNVIQSDGFELPDGKHVTLEEFSEIPRLQRNYFLKYAGTDIAINWGSKTVFHASTLSNTQCRDLLATIRSDTARGRRWVLQEGLEHRESVNALGRDGREIEIATHSKFSGFYGPGGLMGILVMQKASHKVHGSADTIMSAVR